MAGTIIEAIPQVFPEDENGWIIVDCEVIHETPKAILVELNKSTQWIPKNLCGRYEKPPFHSQLAVKDWFYYKHRMQYK